MYKTYLEEIGEIQRTPKNIAIIRIIARMSPDFLIKIRNKIREDQIYAETISKR